MKYTFTIDTDNLNDPDDAEGTVKDLQLLFKVLSNANPNYYLIGNMLNEQLTHQLEQDKHKDKYQKMIDKWDKLWLNMSGYAIYTDANIPYDLKQKIKNFYDQIGEAMGPVCYAGYQVRVSTDDIDIHKWLDECIKYYEEHWEM